MTYKYRLGVRMADKLLNRWTQCVFILTILAVCSFNSLVHANQASAANSTAGPNNTSIKQTDNGSQVITNDDGTSVQTDADGTRIVKNSNGSSVQTNPDGSKLITNADGSSLETNSDGVEVIKKADGSIVK